MITEEHLRDLLNDCGFAATGTETIKDTSRSANVPVEYVRAVKV